MVPGGIGGLMYIGALGVFAVACSTTTDENGVVIEDTCNTNSVTQVLIPVVALLIAVAALLMPFYLLHVVRRRAREGDPATATNVKQAGQPIG